MTVSWIEKRFNRSDKPSVAMRMQLEHLYNNGDVRNYTLVDTDGIVISHAGSMDESNTLAAYVPLLGADNGNLAGQENDAVLTLLEESIPGFSRQNFIAQRFQLDGQDVFLALFSEQNAPEAEHLKTAIEGIKRIVRTTSAFDDTES